MARKKKEIEPIEVVTLLGPVECDNCHTDINIKQMDAHHFMLDSNGDVLASKDWFIEGGKCPKCGKEFDVIKDGMYYRIKDRANARFEGRGEEFSICLSDRSRDDKNNLIDI